jgi:4-aminobutyrate--pyruvate transaminase
MALCPPLIITEPQIDELFDKLTRSLDQTLEFARARGALA